MVCFIKNPKRYWLISLECALQCYIILWKLLRSEAKLWLICEIMKAHTAYLSSQSSTWNFYICVFLTLRPIWLCWSFYTTCNNIMCFITLRTNYWLAPYFFLHIKVCEWIKYIWILLFYSRQITFIVYSNGSYYDEKYFTVHWSKLVFVEKNLYRKMSFVRRALAFIEIKTYEAKIGFAKANKWTLNIFYNNYRK